MKTRPKERHEATPRQIVDNALSGANDINVAVGPLSWQPSDGTAGRVWYFLIATSEARRGFRVDQVTVNGESEDERLRVLLEFAQRRPPLVIHTFDDELDMARWCEILWPGERITKIRENMERERAIRAEGS